jgi:hypothetical protein
MVMFKKSFIFAALACAASPSLAATVIIDTGINPAQRVFTRPVNNDTVLLGQFSLAHGSIVDQILAFGRIVTAGDARFSLFANQSNNTPLLAPYSAADPDFGAIRTITKSFAVMPKNGYYGVGGLSPAESLNWILAAGTYWVGVGQAVQGNSFTSTVRGDAPNPLGLEGAIKPKGYVATDNANLSWQLSGRTIAAAVPEPATWAMMLVGFGLVGGAIRSSRRRPILNLAAAR